jgi:hypothetical protein
MQLTPEQIVQVQELAGLFYTPTELATIMELPLQDCEDAMSIPGNAFYKAYYTGYFTAEVELRKAVKKVALIGSSPAQTMLQKIIDNNKMQRV